MTVADFIPACPPGHTTDPTPYPSGVYADLYLTDDGLAAVEARAEARARHAAPPVSTRPIVPSLRSECPQCGRTFERRSASHRYCTQACTRAAAKARYDADTIERDCAWCGRPFRAKRVRSGEYAHCCSQRCGTKHGWRKRQERLARQAGESEAA